MEILNRTRSQRRTVEWCSAGAIVQALSVLLFGLLFPTSTLAKRKAFTHAYSHLRERTDSTKTARSYARELPAAPGPAPARRRAGAPKTGGERCVFRVKK